MLGKQVTTELHPQPQIFMLAAKQLTDRKKGNKNPSPLSLMFFHMRWFESIKDSVKKKEKLVERLKC
jgi:hypothetical protein